MLKIIVKSFHSYRTNTAVKQEKNPLKTYSKYILQNLEKFKNKDILTILKYFDDNTTKLKILRRLLQQLLSPLISLKLDEMKIALTKNHPYFHYLKLES